MKNHQHKKQLALISENPSYCSCYAMLQRESMCLSYVEDFTISSIHEFVIIFSQKHSKHKIDINILSKYNESIVSMKNCMYYEN